MRGAGAHREDRPRPAQQNARGREIELECDDPVGVWRVLSGDPEIRVGGAHRVRRQVPAALEFEQRDLVLVERFPPRRDPPRSMAARRESGIRRRPSGCSHPHGRSAPSHQLSRTECWTVAEPAPGGKRPCLPSCRGPVQSDQQRHDRCCQPRLLRHTATPLDISGIWSTRGRRRPRTAGPSSPDGLYRCSKSSSGFIALAWGNVQLLPDDEVLKPITDHLHLIPTSARSASSQTRPCPGTM